MSTVLDNIQLFVEVAGQKSFTRAAAALDMPISTLSRRIAKLEEDVNVRLINRNSRKVELSEVGKEFFKRCEYIVAEAVAARDALILSATGPSGRIRLAAPADLVRYCTDFFIAFTQQYPDISLDIRHQEGWGDLIGGPIDVDIRTGELPDSSLVARKLCIFQAALYASPELFAETPPPKTPLDLARFPCLQLEQAPVWVLHRQKQKREVTQRARISVQSMSMLTSMTCAGLGIAAVSVLMATPFVEQGKLVRVLPEWSLPTKPVYAVMAGRQSPARVRLLVDFLAEKLSTALNYPSPPTPIHE